MDNEREILMAELEQVRFKRLRDERFRRSLVSQWHHRGALSENQWPWVAVLLEERKRTKLAEVIQFPGKCLQSVKEA